MKFIASVCLIALCLAPAHAMSDIRNRADCDINGTLRTDFEKVVSEQIGTGEDFLSFSRYQPIIVAYSEMTEDEKRYLIFRMIIMKTKPLSGIVHFLIEGARAVIDPLLEGKCLATAFFEDPRPSKNFADVIKNDIIEIALRYLRSNDPNMTDGIKQFMDILIENGNRVVGKIELMMAELEKSKHCGYWTKTCPAEVKALKVRAKSVVGDQCSSYASIKDYSRYMKKANFFIKKATNMFN